MDVRAALACLATLLLAGDSVAAVCPASCVCITTYDGLHKATCSNVDDLARFLLQKKHHNLNILDLSHNNITKLAHELDNMNELVALDLSTNGFVTVDTFLRNTTKLVHLNLANNRIRSLSFSSLPRKLSSLDLSYNLLNDVPSDLKSLPHLEHLQLEGNPIECSCKNLLLRDYFLLNSISIDNVKCLGPNKYIGFSWLEIKTKDICELSSKYIKMKSMDYNSISANQITDESTMLKFRPSHTLSDLNEGMTWDADFHGKDYESDDEVVFLRAKRQEKVDSIEGSGNNEVTDDYPTTPTSLNEPNEEEKFNGLEGSGEGSGFGLFELLKHDNDNNTEEITDKATEVNELYTDAVAPFLGADVNEEDTSTPYFMNERPSVFKGREWYENTSINTTVTTTEVPVAIGAEKIQIEKTEADQSGIQAETSPTEEKPAITKTGTYVCIAIIAVLLVGLIAFAVIKGQYRKRRDRRLQRQQKRDVEKASREMVDMNTSLLGKPAPTNGAGKKSNGKYELVPTHDSSTKKSENGKVTNSEDLAKKKSSPRDSNQNREEKPRSLDPIDSAVPSGGLAPSSPDSKKENNSLSSEDIFVPESEDVPLSNGVTSSDITQPLTNGDHTDSDYLSPNKYVPVYSVDTGRVRIKMTETPKPKTPVLVNRSRSNAGDIVVTPSLGQTLPESNT